MLSIVLRSQRAVQVNIEIMRAFVRPRHALASNRELAEKLMELERRVGAHDENIQAIFDAIRETRAVYLFDEFDALGTDRASRNEVGEIRRVLNSFLQFIEHDDSDSVIVAATNYPTLLDRALMRRFDAVIEYGLPDKSVVLHVLKNRLGLLKTKTVRWSTVQRAAVELSHADISRACESAVKNAILGRRTHVDTAELVHALKERRSAHA